MFHLICFEFVFLEIVLGKLDFKNCPGTFRRLYFTLTFSALQLTCNSLPTLTVAATKSFPVASNFEDIEIELTNSTAVQIFKDDFAKLGISGNTDIVFK